MEETKKPEAFSLEALQAGDKAAFAQMVESHYELIYRLIVKMLGNSQDAEDVLQETFIKAYRHVGSFDGRARFSTWLYRIATNESLMFLRRRRPETVSIDEPLETDDGPLEPLQIVDWCCLPETELMSTEAQQELEKAIAELPVNLRVVFVLRDIQGLSTHETAQVLDLSESAAKTRLSRARLRLRNELTRYFREKVM